MNSRHWKLGLSLIVVGMFALSEPVRGQGYPSLYGGYGWGGWGQYGNDPGAQFMRGIGSFKRDTGEYEVKEAEAQRIRAETILKWNEALRQANALQRREQERRDAEQAARDEIEQRLYRIESGQALNQLVDTITAMPTDQTKAALENASLNQDTLRAIPFESETESIVISLDMLTGEDGWPLMLRDETFQEPREEFHQAVQAALEEDIEGPISSGTRQRLDQALDDLRAKLHEQDRALNPGWSDADSFLRSLAGMVHLLEDEDAERVVAELESFEDGKLADLISFMQAYNLRFARAQTDAQKQIYHQLYEQLSDIPTARKADAIASETPLIEGTRNLGNAAREVFQNLSWDDLDVARPSGSR